jgi:segregation and condensation protein A
MARDQKVDLAQISILQLADQYLNFVQSAKRLRIELAADYLVMAAWLAYLKSRLLLPDPPVTEEEPTPEEMAQALAFQLRRLEAMRTAAEKLMALPQLGREVFGPGVAEGIQVNRRPVFDCTLYELLKAYADHKRREAFSTLRITPTPLYTLEEALEHLSARLGRLQDWGMLAQFLPEEVLSADSSRPVDPLRGRSAVAAMLSAALELAKAGRIEVRQDRPFAPIWIRPLSQVPQG